MGDDQARGDDDLVRDEDDHDLLTFSESAIRLREEIAQTEEALRAGPSAERQAALTARLGALTDALHRNTRQADASPGDKGFLDYTPRGLPGSGGAGGTGGTGGPNGTGGTGGAGRS